MSKRMPDLIKIFCSVRAQWRWMALCFVLLAPVSSWAQTATTGNNATNTTTPADSSKLKFVNKIGHWITAYGMSGEEFVQDQRDSFKTAAFAEVYIECIIDYDTWLFNLLNRVTKLRNEEKQSPYIFFELKFLPKDATLTSYTIPTFTLKSSSTINDLDKIAADAHTKYLKGKIYAEPVQSIPDVEKAVKEVLKVLKEKLGNSLAPDLMVRYQNEFFWNGHEISILDTEGNSLELEAINKNIQPYSPNDIVWTNADPFGSKGVVDMSGVSSKTVSLKRKSDSLAMTVTVKRASLTDDVNEILKAAIIEALTYKKKEALDSVAQLKKDSITNANNAALFIAQIESENFPLVNDGTSLTPMFNAPLLLSNADEQNLISAKDKRADSFLELKKRKKLRNTIKRKLNVVAFADLVVDHPQEIQSLLNALLENSGRLVAQLILGQTGEGKRDAARNIVVDFLNKNLENIVGNRFPDTVAEPPVVIPVTPVAAASPPAFSADKFLYINKYADFKGKDSLISKLNNYLNGLDTALYVFINYSQDNSREGYLARAKGARPAGLPIGARYKVFTVINIPGSLLEDGFGLDGDNDALSFAGGVGDEVFEKDILSISSYSDEGGTSYNLTGTKSFLTPSGNIITIENLVQVAFVTSFPGKIPSGSLVRFKLKNDEKYEAQYNAGLTQFQGYKKIDNNTEYPVNTALLASEVLLGYPEGNCEIILYQIPVASVKSTQSNIILPRIDYPDKVKIGSAKDTEACLISEAAKAYFNQCSATSTSPNASNSDCFAAAYQMDQIYKINPELLIAYQELYGTQNNLYTTDVVQSLTRSLRDFIVVYNKALTSIKNTSDVKLIISILHTWSEPSYAALSAEDRLYILEQLSKSNLSDIKNLTQFFAAGFGGEDVVITLLKTAKPDQADLIIKGFQERLNKNGQSLFFALYHKMDDVGWGEDNYLKLIFYLTNNFYKSSLYKDFGDDKITNRNTYLFNGMGLWNGQRYTVTEDGKTGYDIVYHTDAGLKYDDWKLTPFTTIKIVSKVKLPFISQVQSETKHYITTVPALYLVYLFDKKRNANSVEMGITSLALVGNALSFGIGGTLMASSSSVLWTLGLCDVISASAGMVIIPSKSFVEIKYGKESDAYKTIDRIDKVTMVYGGARLVSDLLVLPRLYPEAAVLWNKEKEILKRDKVVTQEQYDEIEKIIRNEAVVVSAISDELAAARFGDDILAVGDDLTDAAIWVEKNKSDDFFDVLIHGTDNGNFSVLYNGADVVKTPSQLANDLKGLSSSKMIRLLSCNNAESAIELSVTLGRDVVGSKGVMKLYNDGFIEATDWYKAKPNGTLESITDVPIKDPAITSANEFIVLGRASSIEKLKTLYSISDDLSLSLSKLAGVNKLYSNSTLITKINSLGQYKIDFLTDLTGTDRYFVPRLFDKVADIDDQIVDVWLVMRQNADGWPRKRLSYDYLYKNKSLSEVEIIDDLNKDYRALLASRLEAVCPFCTEAIRDAYKLNANVRSVIIPKIRSGAVASNGMKWEEIYLTFIDEATKLKYTKNGTSPFDWDLFFTLEKYQAHHYFPVNLFADDAGAFRFMFENISSTYKRQLIDFFNSSKNGIMLPNKRLINGEEVVIHTNHANYEAKINDYFKSLMKDYEKTNRSNGEIADKLFQKLLKIEFEDEVMKQSLLMNENVDNIDLSKVLK